MKNNASEAYYARKKQVCEGEIYTTDEPYDDDNPAYNCYLVCMTGDYYMVDCFPCTEDGEIHPDYNAIGVLIYTDYLKDKLN